VKGRRAARLAVAIASEMESALAASGCPAPPREDVVAALWPLARDLARWQKQLKQAEAFHRAALLAVEASESAVMATAAGIAAAWTRQHAAPRQIAVFDPAQWRVALVPGVPTDAERIREAA
jgi:hypothetical protein